MMILHQLYYFLKKIDAIVTEELFGTTEYVMPCERIVFVPGIDTQHFKVRWWQEDLEMAFPTCTVVMFDAYYVHTQHQRVSHFIKKLHTLLSDGKPTVVVAHSFGGLLAKGAINLLNDKHAITLLVTMATPHTMTQMGVRDACRVSGIPRVVSVPLITYAGTHDVIVPEKYAHSADAIVCITLPSTHMGFLYHTQTRRRVINKIQQFLYQD